MKKKLKIMGFFERDKIPIELNIKKSMFLEPNNNDIPNSSIIFDELYNVCL